MWPIILVFLFASNIDVVKSNCYNYGVLSEWDRAISSNTYYCRGNDRYLNGWYRFMGSAGDRMIDYCPYSYSSGSCGSNYKGWLAGSYPRTWEGAVGRTVYFAYSGSCYYASQYIQVQNCGSYYVYRFYGAPMYCGRYCGNGYSAPDWAYSSAIDMEASSTISLDVSSITLSSDIMLPMSSIRQEIPENSDSCRRYQLLHDNTRSVLYEDDSSVTCDNQLHGWYRFTGEAGNRMLDYCPNALNSSSYYSNRCGAYLQGWIPSGAMPSVHEGEVSRMVCFSRYRSCSCWYTTQIKVRNCGTFYVYWLNSVPTCNLRYCGIKDDSASVSCTENYMRIDLEKKYYDESAFSSITLRDPSCSATFSSSQISLGTIPHLCKSSRKETNDHIVYENEVIFKAAPQDGLVTRELDQRVRFTCSFKKYGYLSSLSFYPINSVNVTESGFGSFTYYFRMYKDKYYRYLNYHYPVKVSLRELLYFEAYASVSDRDLVVLLDQCFSTPTIDRNHPDKYLFINDRCAKDDTVKFHKTSGNRQRFSMQAFKYARNSSVVYVHCVVFLCRRSSKNYKCNSGCEGNNVNRVNRAKRDIEGGYGYKNEDKSYTKYYLLEAGPFELSDELSDSKVEVKTDKQKSSSSFSTTTLLLIVGIASLALVVIGLVLKLRQSARVVRKEAGEIGIDNAPQGNQYTLSDEENSAQKDDKMEICL